MAKRRKRKPNTAQADVKKIISSAFDSEALEETEKTEEENNTAEFSEENEAVEEAGKEEMTAEPEEEATELVSESVTEPEEIADEDIELLHEDDEERHFLFNDMESLDLTDDEAVDEEIKKEKAARKSKESSSKDRKSGRKSGKRKETSSDLGVYIKDIFYAIGDWISVNRVKLCRFLVVLILAIIAFAAIRGMSKARQRQAQEGDQVDLDALSGDVIPIPVDAMKKDAYPELNELVKNYFTAMQDNDLYTYTQLRSQTDALEEAKLGAKSEYIESYDNICCYTKAGPYTDSYMVYVTYDLKLKDWDKTAPALVTLVVCTNEKGELYVYSGSFEENVAEYIKGITSQEDVVELYNSVEQEYKEVVEADPAFREYMSALNQLIKDGVGERVAAAREQAAAEEPDETGESGNEGNSDETANTDTTTATEEGNGTDEQTTEPEKPTEIIVEATANVNVRSSDSENADKLGRVSEGTQLTCTEQLQNGWSKVQYEGKDAFIKTEFLKVIGANAEDATGMSVVGSVTAKENVNVRVTAETDGEKLGVVNSGDKLEVLEKDKNGWTKVKYKGKVGYVKTEFVK
ncbi:MAG: SH3 domain-containing protein [Lachnospiraceae bacterium]|nr:SH3 domain-containing protein [Lachnospiraceae bacterium]